MICSLSLLNVYDAQDFYNYENLDFNGNGVGNGNPPACRCVCDSQLSGRAKVSNSQIASVSLSTPNPTCQGINVTEATSTCTNGVNNIGCLDCVDYTQHPMYTLPELENFTKPMLQRIFGNQTTNLVRGCWIASQAPAKFGPIPIIKTWACFTDNAYKPCFPC